MFMRQIGGSSCAQSFVCALLLLLLTATLPASAQTPPLNTALITRDIAQLEEQLRLLKQRRQLASELDQLMRQDRSIGVLEPGSPLAPRDGSWAAPFVAYADVFSMQITSAVLTGDMSTQDAEFAGRLVGQEFSNGRRWLHNQLVELALQEADLEQRIARLRQQSAPPSERNALSRDWTYQLTWSRRPAWSGTWRGGKMRLDTRKPGTLLGNIAWLTENPDLGLSGNYAYPSSPGSPNQVFFNFDERSGNRLRFEGQFNNPDQMTGRFYEMRMVDTSRSLDYSAQELGTWVARAVPLPAVDGLEGRSVMVMMPASGGLKEAEACIGGTTNISLNCLDRHRGTPIWTKPAVIGEDEEGNTRTWTYEELDDKVNQLAQILRDRKIGTGDVVALYLPMIPEAAAAFLAIVKIGAIALPLFSGFGPSPIRQRLKHSGARAIITVEHMRRRGQSIALKATLDAALEDNATVHTVVVVQRGDASEFSAGTGRDVQWAPESPTPSGACPTEIVAAEAPAMLMYTSGTTGQPKGTVHTHCGMLGKNALDMGLCIDIKSSDTLLWMSDMGWIVGPKIVMSSTLLGATLVMAEGTPDWPNPNRLWQIAAKHAVTVVGIVPTAVRQMMRYGPNIAAEYDLSRLRVTLSAGEMWNEEAWLWFFENICKRRIPILNYAGGTECGGAILIGNLLAPPAPGCFRWTCSWLWRRRRQSGW